MIAIAAALLSVSAAPCAPVSGADVLWQAETRWVIVGEMHGTNEIPDAFANLVCLAVGTGRPVTVAVEYPADGQAAIDAYLASNGDEAARAALLSLPVFAREMQDGRGSIAFLRLFDRLRRMKQAGEIVGVVASDVAEAASGEQPRDAAMAKAWQNIPAASNGIILALVGNVHAMRHPVQLGSRTVTPAASLLPADRTITVNLTGGGGTAWYCRMDSCGAYPAGQPSSSEPGIRPIDATDRRWDVVYQLGIPTTAAEPAVMRRDATPTGEERAAGGGHR